MWNILVDRARYFHLSFPKPMSSRRTLFAAAVVGLFIHTAPAQQSVDDWQKKAVADFPLLATKGSEFNRQFITKVQLLHRTDPAFFNDPRWPYTLAEQVSKPPIIPGLENIPSARINPQTIVPQSKAPAITSPPKSGSDSPSPSAGIELDRNWNSVMQGGSATMKDLAKLLSPLADPSSDRSFVASIPIYKDITYLMPLEAAKTVLGVQGKLSSKNLVACPGFPRDSCFYHSFDGFFDEKYEEACVVVDKKDQVVCIQFSTRKPSGMVLNRRDDELSTYNFINARSKGISTERIGYMVQGLNLRFHTWRPMYADHLASEGRNAELTSYRVDTALYKSTRENGLAFRPSDCAEAARLYIPRPFVQLILFNVNKALQGS